MPTERARAPRVWLLLAALAVLPYLNALRAGFTFDDEFDIRGNTAVTQGIDVVQVLASPTYPGDLFRPLTMFTFAVNHALTPDNPVSFHFVNLLLHAAVTLLVYALARRLFGEARLAAIAAALFALHPIHTEAVTSLVGRAEVMAALFGVAALVTAAAATGTARWPARSALQLLSLTMFSLALLSKESALTVLPLIPLCRVAVRREPLGAGLRRELRSLDWVPYALCAAVFLALRFYVVGAVQPPDPLTPLDNVLAFVPWTVRVPSALGVLWDYFGLLNLPFVLSADYSYNQVPVLTSWLSLRCLAGAALLTAGVLVWARNRRPGVGFAVAIGFVTLSVTANLLFPIGTIKAERLLYLPSVGWALVVAWTVDRLLCVQRYRALAAGALCMMVATFGARTWLRNWDWRDNATLYRSMVDNAPDSAKARFNLGVALQNENADAAADAEFRRALDIYRWAEGAALGIGIGYEKKGLTDQAADWYAKALAIAPKFDKAHTSLCRVYLNGGRFDAAAAACRRGLRLKPTDADLLKGLGASLVGSGDTAKGIAVLRRSLALNREDGQLRTYLAQLEPTARVHGGEGVTVQ